VKNQLKLLLFSVLILLSQTSKVRAQTFWGQPGAIPDNNTFADFGVNVTGMPATIDTSFGLARVCFSITHSNTSHLQMQLVSPSGKVVCLFSGIGWDGDNYSSTCLGGQSLPLIYDAGAPFTGSFRPAQSLGHMNNGQSANGTWKLRIRDQYAGEPGYVTGFSITFSNQPVKPYRFESSNLPVVILDTRSQFIPDEPKIPARIKIIHQTNGSRNFVSDSSQFPWMLCGVEQRGSSSSTFPKKSYGFEIRDAVGEDMATSILGMPAESDWILSANYSDKSFMRNTFAYDLARSMGWYASRTKYAELILNGEYQGIYVVMEKIKRDADRVNISKLKPTDISGADVTGGYIVKIDKSTGNDTESWASTFPPENSSGGQQIRFFYDYPDAVDMMPQQKAYIQSYLDSFETAVHAPDFATANGYRKYAHVPSFIDFFLINEWSKNVDGYRISTFLTKPKITQNGGKLTMGPVWDFDIAWRNSNYCEGDKVYGWQYEIEDVCPGGYWQPPTWWKRFRQDPGFTSSLKCRWLEVTQSIWQPARRVAWVDSVKTLLNESQQRNFQYWPILGQYVWPNPDPIYTSYAGETAGFQNWLNQRANWMSANIGGTCVVENKIVSLPPPVFVFPNPASGTIRINGDFHPVPESIQITNALGQSFRLKPDETGELDVSQLPDGVYEMAVAGFQPFRFVKVSGVE
jgi:subtilisin-like proprotein convertase family protein